MVEQLECVFRCVFNLVLWNNKQIQFTQVLGTRTLSSVLKTYLYPDPKGAVLSVRYPWHCSDGYLRRSSKERTKTVSNRSPASCWESHSTTRNTTGWWDNPNGRWPWRPASAIFVPLPSRVVLPAQRITQTIHWTIQQRNLSSMNASASLNRAWASANDFSDELFLPPTRAIWVGSCHCGFCYCRCRWYCCREYRPRRGLPVWRLWPLTCLWAGWGWYGNWKCVSDYADAAAAPLHRRMRETSLYRKCLANKVLRTTIN